MATTREEREHLEKRRAELLAELASVGDFRPGSLVGRYRRCGKPTCHCATDTAGGHGPSWSLTRQVAGKTVTRIIPAGAVEQTQQQLDEYRRFRHLTRELVEVSERLCEARLSAPGPAAEAAEKGGSSKASTPPSAPRSRRS